MHEHVFCAEPYAEKLTKPSLSTLCNKFYQHRLVSHAMREPFLLKEESRAVNNRQSIRLQSCREVWRVRWMWTWVQS